MKNKKREQLKNAPFLLKSTICCVRKNIETQFIQIRQVVGNQKERQVLDLSFLFVAQRKVRGFELGENLLCKFARRAKWWTPTIYREAREKQIPSSAGDGKPLANYRLLSPYQGAETPQPSETLLNHLRVNSVLFSKLKANRKSIRF